ncbi:DUF1016 family protein [Candidatus Woesearchaeota archaeon]|nr:DUF1016 family protein [Candidatus Woesearchaeota archaeon]
MNKRPIYPTKDYQKLIFTFGELLHQARKQAVSEVNKVLLITYWEMGRHLVEYEQGGKNRAEYGGHLLDTLSKDLTSSYGSGFSRDNLERMRKIYIMFPNSATLSRKLSWSHYCLLLRVANETARNFYLIETEKEDWGVRELGRQINSLLFERVAASKDTKSILALAQNGQVIETSRDLVKDPYFLEFLGLEPSEKYTETELENKIIFHLKQFLLELGKGFMFVARQQKISLEGEHFYIDLVFYNRILRCFVLIELKIGKLTHQDLGQLQMYVNYYDRTFKHTDENSTIGILLCADKKEAIVKYTLPEGNKHIFASEYKLYLPKKEDLELHLRKLLKTPE